MTEVMWLYYREAMYTVHLAIGMLMVDFFVSPELRVRPSMCWRCSDRSLFSNFSFHQMNLLDGNHCCCTTMSETSQIKNASCPGWRRKCNTYSKWFAAHRISHLYKLSEEKMRVLLVDSIHQAPSMYLYWFGWLYCPLSLLLHFF